MSGSIYTKTAYTRNASNPLHANHDDKSSTDAKLTQQEMQSNNVRGSYTTTKLTEQESKLICSAISIQNRLTEQFKNSDLLLLDFYQLEKAFDDSRASIMTMLEQAFGTVSTSVQEMIQAILGSMNIVELLIRNNQYYEESINELRLNSFKTTKKLNRALKQLKAQLPPSQQDILDAYLNKYQLDFNMELTKTKEEYNQKLSAAMSDFHAKTLSQQAEYLKHIASITQSSEIQLQKIHSLNNEININNAKFKAELENLNSNTIKLSAALTAMGITMTGAVIGSVIIPIPVIGTLIGGTIGGGISYIAHKINDNCSIQ